MAYSTVIILVVSLCSVNAALTINVFDNVPETQNSVSDSCNYQACDQLCRRLGFPGGACVGDRCQCDNFKHPLGQEALSSEDVSSCNYRACDQLCRRLGFPGGACVGDRCKCDNFKQPDEVSEISVKENEISRESNEIPVSRKADVEVKDNAVVESQDEEASEFVMRSLVNRGSCDCVPRNCDMYCFRIRYTGGICVTGQCRCYK